MRRGRFTEDQIIGVLREHEAGVKTADLCRKHGISDATFYNWKSKYGGLTVAYVWTKGYVPRFDTYPGFETPNPIAVHVDWGEADIETVAADILALTKVNFNGCNFADGLPVTLKFADAIGEILTAAPNLDGAPLPFKYYI